MAGIFVDNLFHILLFIVLFTLAKKNEIIQYYSCIFMFNTMPQMTGGLS